MASVMRAIRVAQFGGPEVLRVVKDAVRPAPAAREVSSYICKQFLLKYWSTG